MGGHFGPRIPLAPIQPTRIKYRVFVQDVGDEGFSGVADVEAPNPQSAVSVFAYTPAGATWHNKTLIALPHTRKDLWPDGKTGAVSQEALKMGLP